MRPLLVACLCVSLLGCAPARKTDTQASLDATRLTECRFDFAADGSATALCSAADATVKMSFPSCGAGKPEGPGVQIADEQAVFSSKACISSFGGQKWVVEG